MSLLHPHSSHFCYQLGQMGLTASVHKQHILVCQVQAITNCPHLVSSRNIATTHTEHNRQHHTGKRYTIHIGKRMSLLHMGVQDD